MANWLPSKPRWILANAAFLLGRDSRVFYPPLHFKLQRGARCWVVQHLPNCVRYQRQYNPSWTGILPSYFPLTSRSKRQILHCELNYVTCEFQCVVTVLFCTAIRTPLFIRKLVFNLRKKQYKLLHLEHNFVWCRNLDTSKNTSETPGKFWNVIPKKEREHKPHR